MSLVSRYLLGESPKLKIVGGECDLGLFVEEKKATSEAKEVPKRDKASVAVDKVEAP